MGVTTLPPDPTLDFCPPEDGNLQASIAGCTAEGEMFPLRFDGVRPFIESLKEGIGMFCNVEMLGPSASGVKVRERRVWRLGEALLLSITSPLDSTSGTNPLGPGDAVARYRAV